MFAMKFNTGSDSEIIFGDYNDDIADSDDIKWEKNLGPNRWNVTIKDLVYGGKQIPVPHNWTIITSAESHMRMYRRDFYPIELDLKKKSKNCTYRSMDYLYQCEVDDESLSPFGDIDIHLKKTVIYLEAPFTLAHTYK